MAWKGNSEGHAAAGRIGGKKQGKHNNPANFANNKDLARRAGSLGGKAERVKLPPIEKD